MFLRLLSKDFRAEFYDFRLCFNSKTCFLELGGVGFL